MQGATLTITKGVKVIFLADNDDTMSGDTAYDSELIVKGTLGAGNGGGACDIHE